MTPRERIDPRLVINNLAPNAIHLKAHTEGSRVYGFGDGTPSTLLRYPVKHIMVDALEWDTAKEAWEYLKVAADKVAREIVSAKEIYWRVLPYVEQNLETGKYVGYMRFSVVLNEPVEVVDSICDDSEYDDEWGRDDQ